MLQSAISIRKAQTYLVASVKTQSGNSAFVNRQAMCLSHISDEFQPLHIFGEINSVQGFKVE